MDRLVKEFGSRKVSEITVEQIYTGMRGVNVQVSDISYVDPNLGILFRGYSMQELLTLLPKAPNSEYPLAWRIVLYVDGQSAPYPPGCPGS